MQCSIRCLACGGTGLLDTSTYFSVLKPGGAKQSWQYQCVCCKGTGLVLEDRRLAMLAEEYEQDIGCGLVLSCVVVRA